MKRLSLVFAVLLCATAGLRAQTDLVVRIHFAGADRIAADPNHAAFTTEFCSAEAKALESQTLDKLSRAPGEWFKSKLPPGAGDGAAQLRPLLDDFLKSEWVFEIRDAPNGPPEYALAIHLDAERAQLWSKNLAAVLRNWTGIGISQDKSGIWELKKHEPPNLVRFSRAGDWVVVDCGQDKLTLRNEILSPFEKTRIAVAETNWLTADLNWPRLAQLFPALRTLDFPKMAMQIVGRDGSLQWNGKFTLAQPLPPPGNWRVPTNLIHAPLVSLTAVRGIGPWLARQSWTRPYQISPMPDQWFIWAMAQIPFQTFAAAPVPDAPAALAQFGPKISASLDAVPSSVPFFKLTAQMTNDDIVFTGVPFIAPFVQAVHSPAGDFLIGGFFPNTPRPRSQPPESFAQLAAPNLVFYHWEITSNRLALLPQLSQLGLMVSGSRQLGDQSAAYKWLERLGPTLGKSESVTEITQTAPAELTFTRRAAAGLTAVELTALANWLEAPNFPGCDLRLPPMPPRSGQRPLRPPGRPPAPTPH
jgi:hypothetical protein